MVFAKDSLSKGGNCKWRLLFKKNKIFCLIGNNTSSILQYENPKYKNKTLKTPKNSNQKHAAPQRPEVWPDWFCEIVLDILDN